MGACFEDDKKRNNTWGSKNQNQKENGEQNKENNINNNDHNYIMQKRAEFFQSDNFKKKQIFNNE